MPNRKETLAMQAKRFLQRPHGNFKQAKHLTPQVRLQPVAETKPESNPNVNVEPNASHLSTDAVVITARTSPSQRPDGRATGYPTRPN